MATNANSEFSNADTVTDDTLQGGDTVDNSYASRTGQKDGPIPVVKDEQPVEQPNDRFDPDSDKMLEQDEKAAINSDNIIDGRTREAAKPKGTYREPGDEEGLPSGEDGTSSTR